jgi:hypothetical protein
MGRVGRVDGLVAVQGLAGKVNGGWLIVGMR